MLAYVLSKLVTLTYGLMYPAYCSYKAVKTKDVREYVHWMMYWIAFAVFTVFEAFADTFIGCWFPFYYEGKILFLLWMISSSTRGGAIMYRRYIHPTLTQHEAEIDACLADFKVKASGALMTWGYKFVTSITDVLMAATFRAGEPMMDHFRRTYSLNDLNRGSSSHLRAAGNNRPGGDYTDGFMPRSISGDLHFERNLPVQAAPTAMDLEDTVLIEELPQEVRAGPSSDGSSPEMFAPTHAEVRRVRTRSRTRKPASDMYDEDGRIHPAVLEDILALQRLWSSRSEDGSAYGLPLSFTSVESQRDSFRTYSSCSSRSTSTLFEDPMEEDRDDVFDEINEPTDEFYDCSDRDSPGSGVDSPPPLISRKNVKTVGKTMLQTFEARSPQARNTAKALTGKPLELLSTISNPVLANELRKKANAERGLGENNVSQKAKGSPAAEKGDRADASNNNRRRVKTKKTTERSTEKTA